MLEAPVHGMQAACSGLRSHKDWRVGTQGRRVSIDLSLYVPTELTSYRYWLQLLERQ